MITKEDLAYAAGIIDGEGTININKHPTISHGCKSYLYDLRVKVSNTNILMIKWLKKKFGGSSFKEYRNKKRPNSRLIYEWNLISIQAEKFLNMIYPYIVAKNEEIKVALKYRKTYKKQYAPKSVPKNISKIRENCRMKLMKLHKKEWN